MTQRRCARLRCPERLFGADVKFSDKADGEGAVRAVRRIANKSFAGHEAKQSRGRGSAIAEHLSGPEDFYDLANRNCGVAAMYAGAGA